MAQWDPAEWMDKMLMLERKPGVFVRHMDGYTDDVSGDQLVPVFATAIVNRALQRRILKTLALRLGFAQNYRRMNEREFAIQISDLFIT
jgi:hypothetical protein